MACSGWHYTGAGQHTHHQPPRAPCCSFHACHTLARGLLLNSTEQSLLPVSGNRGHEGCGLVRQVAAESLPSGPCQPAYLVAYKILGHPLSTPSEWCDAW
jgi:hypothetical protein